MYRQTTICPDCGRHLTPRRQSGMGDDLRLPKHKKVRNGPECPGSGLVVVPEEEAEFCPGCGQRVWRQ